MSGSAELEEPLSQKNRLLGRQFLRCHWHIVAFCCVIGCVILLGTGEPAKSNEAQTAAPWKELSSLVRENDTNEWP